MDRRDFIKKSAIAVAGVAAGAAIASPITSTIIDKNNEKRLKNMKVLLINGSP
ncbi:MAG: twin-arginine translocation signal domain-containing protein, partial [Bacteroidales bacterium]|nr:twin-arginine translocation signal domain-containing protein [Bacteroidales bacterium]